MTSHSVKTIPEALLKLKAALEEGKYDDVPKKRTAQEHVHATNEKPKRNSYKQHVSNAATKKIAHEKVGAHRAINLKVENKKDAEILSGGQKPQRENEKPIPLGKNERVKTALAWLYKTFPDVFRIHDRLPLKIGITSDVAAWIDAHQQKQIQSSDDSVSEAENVTQMPYIPSKTAIRDAITVYTSSRLYQKTLLQNDKRYDLSGNEAGVVEEQQKAHANQRNATIEAAIQVQVEKREAFRERLKISEELRKAEQQAKGAADGLSTDG
jgi:sRNA-binding protein